MDILKSDYDLYQTTEEYAESMKKLAEVIETEKNKPELPTQLLSNNYTSLIEAIRNIDTSSIKFELELYKGVIETKVLLKPAEGNIQEIEVDKNGKVSLKK